MPGHDAALDARLHELGIEYEQYDPDDEYASDPRISDIEHGKDSVKVHLANVKLPPAASNTYQQTHVEVLVRQYALRLFQNIGFGQSGLDNLFDNIKILHEHQNEAFVEATSCGSCVETTSKSKRKRADSDGFEGQNGGRFKIQKSAVGSVADSCSSQKFHLDIFGFARDAVVESGVEVQILRHDWATSRMGEVINTVKEADQMDVEAVAELDSGSLALPTPGSVKVSLYQEAVPFPKNWLDCNGKGLRVRFQSNQVMDGWQYGGRIIDGFSFSRGLDYFDHPQQIHHYLNQEITEESRQNIWIRFADDDDDVVVHRKDLKLLPKVQVAVARFDGESLDDRLMMTDDDLVDQVTALKHARKIVSAMKHFETIGVSLENPLDQSDSDSAYLSQVFGFERKESQDVKFIGFDDLVHPPGIRQRLEVGDLVSKDRFIVADFLIGDLFEYLFKIMYDDPEVNPMMFEKKMTNKMFA